MKLKVFVIIVTYKGQIWYEKLFSSLRLSTIPVNVIVVNNGGDDGTKEYIEERFPEVIILDPKENLGFGKGNNLGFRYALEHDSDYVFLLNQDAWIEPDTIAKLVSIHKNHSEFGLLSPMHLNADGTGLVMKCFCQQPNNEKLITDLYLDQLTDIYETTYINAAAWLLPRKTLETVGGFDPIYKHYEEDDDYLNRVRFHHLKIGVCPSARIVHDHRGPSNNPFNTKTRYHHEQELLVKLTDLNSSMSLRENLCYYIRKIIKSLLTWDLASFRYYRDDFLFIIKQRKVICKSRENNSRIGPTWLTA